VEEIKLCQARIAMGLDISTSGNGWQGIWQNHNGDAIVWKSNEEDK